MWSRHKKTCLLGLWHGGTPKTIETSRLWKNASGLAALFRERITKALIWLLRLLSVPLLRIDWFMYLLLVCGGFFVGLCFGMHYFVSFLDLPLSWCGREIWLLCFYCLSDVLLLLIFYGSSSWCHGLICSVWLWYFSHTDELGINMTLR